MKDLRNATPNPAKFQKIHDTSPKKKRTEQLHTEVCEPLRSRRAKGADYFSKIVPVRNRAAPGITFIRT